MVFLLLLLGWISGRIGMGLREILLPAWRMKYLVFGTLMMHLLMTPGRTLMGFEWLSYDGLIRGGRLSLSLVLAVLAAKVLTRGLGGGEFIRFLKGVLRPAEYAGLCVTPLLMAVAGVFHFLPMVATAGRGLRAECGSGRAGGLRTVIQNLFSEADRIALCESSGEDPLQIRKDCRGTEVLSTSADVVLICSVAAVTILAFAG